MAELQKTVQDTTNKAQQGASEGTKKWEAMSEEQKKHTFDNLPAEQKKGKTYVEWIQEGYHHQYENWMPWIEDLYLKWFTKDNKASYATKDSLDKTKVTGIEQVDTLQDGVNNLVGGQVGKGGLLQPVGDVMSTEGINRAERGGKDEKGTYTGPASSYTDPVVRNAQSASEGVASGAQSAGNTAWSGVQSAGGAIGGMFGGGKK
ncbi:hypothetical protein BAUCODRAFT_172695 [Baudoinia panamericana UAMH 10762]|uniref:Uncharacterized protein n=1 Tax=Baudoinia panamericana (strain UAMH 10762) TaxID=717646 RepID=M2NMV9_BAUPA|nr:uncharacterized protein BAUCODRAFT_172695 [Baudoinia panamericana UAMH 10762]EMD00531.1 hypothetical protein BAUCODRAFT_172695 [Baudoinia panamericana UAMH 10762]